MNDTEKKQLLEKFPELLTLVQKLKSLGAFDIDYYRDKIFMTIMVNTSRNDRDTLGTLTRLIHLSNKELDDKQRKGIRHAG